MNKLTICNNFGCISKNQSPGDECHSFLRGIMKLKENKYESN